MINFKEQFNQINNLSEAKKLYKNLANIFHPDKGGSVEDFKVLNNAYHSFIDNFSISHVLDNDFEDLNMELEKVIIDILHYENIVIEIIGSWVWVSGDTREIKEILKGLGFKWAKKKKMWFFGDLKKSRGRGSMDINDIKSKYGFKEVKTRIQKKIKG